MYIIISVSDDDTLSAFHLQNTVFIVCNQVSNI
jgi:hypothetical protein